MNDNYHLQCELGLVNFVYLFYDKLCGM